MPLAAWTWAPSVSGADSFSEKEGDSSFPLLQPGDQRHWDGGGGPVLVARIPETAFTEATSLLSFLSASISPVVLPHTWNWGALAGSFQTLSVFFLVF